MSSCLARATREGVRGKKLTLVRRAEFVRLYVEFHLTTSIQSQFAAFSAGFHEVVAGNSLSLFKGEELELLVRGSDEQLDVEQLKGVTEYKGWDAQDETVLFVVADSLSLPSQRIDHSHYTHTDYSGTSSLPSHPPPNAPYYPSSPDPTESPRRVPRPSR